MSAKPRLRPREPEPPPNADVLEFARALARAHVARDIAAWKESAHADARLRPL